MNVSALSRPVGSRIALRRLGWTLLLLGALFAAANAMQFAFVDSHGSPEIKQRFMSPAIVGWAHALGGAVVVLIGPFQFLSVIRRRAPQVHVWLGRTYLIVGLAGVLAGLYFAPASLGGPTTSIGFGLLGVLWLYTGTRAFLAIRRRDVQAHRRWMIRNYSLTFAAATLRIEVLLLILGVGLSDGAAYQVVAWSSWGLNLLAVELWLQRSGSGREDSR